jgi:hypothetical protein
MKKVSQRNAPGAISAIAFTVNPVRPNVDGGFGVAGSGDMQVSFFAAHTARVMGEFEIGNKRSRGRLRR